MHNTPEQNADFRRAWDATNARYKAFDAYMKKQEAQEKNTQELTDHEIKCPHCHNIVSINGLIGKSTNDCPICGKRALFKPTRAA